MGARIDTAVPQPSGVHIRDAAELRRPPIHVRQPIPLIAWLLETLAVVFNATQPAVLYRQLNLDLRANCVTYRVVYLS
jgi:hypothetical protein